jgi:hypothetical protein
LDLAETAKVAAIEALLLAGDGVEGAAVGGIEAAGVAEEETVLKFGGLGRGNAVETRAVTRVPGCQADALVPVAGLDADDAAEAPLGFGEGADEAVFDGALGLESGFELADESEVVFGIFGGEDNVFGIEAVFDGVSGGGGLAPGGSGAGAALCVAPIGADLAIGCHESWRLLSLRLW